MSHILMETIPKCRPFSERFNLEKIYFSAIGVLVGSSILFCTMKSISMYLKSRTMVTARRCNMYDDDGELDESTSQALIDLWYSTTFGEQELFNAERRHLTHSYSR